TFSSEPQPPQETDLFRGRIAAQRRVTKEFPEARLFIEGLLRLLFDELELLGVAGSQPPVQHYLHAEASKVDVPGFDQRIQEGHAIFRREVEDVRVQELEDDHSHVFVAAAAQSCHQADPVLALKLLLGAPLDSVQELMRHETFELSEGLLLEDHADLWPSRG